MKYIELFLVLLVLLLQPAPIVGQSNVFRFQVQNQRQIFIQKDDFHRINITIRTNSDEENDESVIIGSIDLIKVETIGTKPAHLSPLVGVALSPRLRKTGNPSPAERES